MTINHTTPYSTQMLTSSDGATVSYLTIGNGPAVIVIHGALSRASSYLEFARALAEHFTVHLIERRGRGQSSPQGDDYSIVKECEDVQALQAHTGASLLVGHSFGGLVALETARNNRSFSKVAVYEPGVSINGAISLDWAPAYSKMLAEKKYLDAFVEFSKGTGPDSTRNVPRELMKQMIPSMLSPEELEMMFSLLSENLREHQEVARLDNSYENYREIPAEVLLMYGGKTNSAWVDLSMERLAAVLPHSTTRMFPELDHFGIDKRAPQEVAQAVSSFFLNER